MRYGVLSLLAFQACARPARPASRPDVALHQDQCAVLTGSAANALAATICAEAFILRQGFTLAVVTDTSELRWGFIEPGANRRELLANRRGMLPPQAKWVCPMGRSFLIFFPYLGTHPYAAPRIMLKGAGAVDTLRGPWGRIVTMTAFPPVLKDVEIRHSELTDDSVAFRGHGCLVRSQVVVGGDSR